MVYLVQKASGAAFSASSVSATFASTPSVGSILIAIVGATAGTPQVSGWTNIVLNNSPSNRSIRAMYKIVGSSEPKSVVATSSTSSHLLLNVYELSGVDTTSPVFSTGLSSGTREVSLTDAIASENIYSIAAFSSGSSGVSGTSIVAPFSNLDFNSSRMGIGYQSQPALGILTAKIEGNAYPLNSIIFALNPVPNQQPITALSLPTDNAILTTATPTLAFTATDPDGDQVSYQVQVGNSDFSTLHMDVTTATYASGTQQTRVVSPALTQGGIDYYWRVRAKDPLGTNAFGAWSTTQSFNVITFTSPFPTFFRP